MIDVELFSEDFLGDLLIMIIGLVILGIGAQLFIAGAYVSSFNYFMTILLMIVGIVLIGFGARILMDLIERIRKRKSSSTQ